MDGGYINCEIQKSDDDNHLKRTRFNASCITANVSEPGENFEHVKDVYIVYISKFDVFKKGRRLYHVGRAILDLPDVTPVSDGEKFIYVNGSTNVSADAEDEDVAELMEFFKNSNGMNEKFKNLSERVNELKNEESEVLAVLSQNTKKNYILRMYVLKAKQKYSFLLLQTETLHWNVLLKKQKWI